MAKFTVIFLYTKENRYSVNALLSSLQLYEELLKSINVVLAYTPDDLFKHIELNIHKSEKLIVGLSFTTLQFTKIKTIAKSIKDRYSEKVILLCGGSHVTGSPNSTLTEANFDIAVLHEGEAVFPKIIESICFSKDIYELNNIAYVKDGKVHITNIVKSEVDIDKYPAVPFLFNRFGPIEITRGCPFQCYFCQTSQIFGTKLRHRSVEKICEAVEIMASKGLYDTRFITPSLFLYGSPDGKNLNLDKLEQLFKNVSKIIKPKGKLFIGTFPSEIRPEHINKDTIALLEKYADNDNVIIGAQSGSDRILQLCHRGHTVSDVYNAVRLLSETKFKINLDFIFGFPYENEQDVKQTMKVIDDLVTKYKVRIHAHFFMPLVGTKFENCKPSNVDVYISYCKALKSKGLLYGEWEKQVRLW